MIALPTTCKILLDEVVEPALQYLPSKMRSDAAKLLLLATAKQESGLSTRLQRPNGPAHSLWQCEKGGAVHAVIKHAVVGPIFQGVCRQFHIAFDDEAVYEEILINDSLACCLARLNYWAASGPLPVIGDEEGAWEYYLEAWNPGKPDKNRWPAAYSEAVDAVA